MDIKIKVAVKPLVKHYLELNFGKQIYLNQYSTVGKYFLNILNKQSHEHDHKYAGYSETVEVIFSDWYLINNGHVLTASALADFNNFVTELVYELMFLSVKVEKDCCKVGDMTLAQLRNYRKDLSKELKNTPDGQHKELKAKLKEVRGVIARQQAQESFEIKKAIKSFLMRFNITEDIIKFDTAEKAYFRRKKRNKALVWA